MQMWWREERTVRYSTIIWFDLQSENFLTPKWCKQYPCILASPKRTAALTQFSLQRSAQRIRLECHKLQLDGADSKLGELVVVPSRRLRFDRSCKYPSKMAGKEIQSHATIKLTTFPSQNHHRNPCSLHHTDHLTQCVLPRSLFGPIQKHFQA